MPANHLDNIQITIILGAVPSSQIGFHPLLMVDEGAGANTLNGARVVSYTELAGATADETAGFIEAATLEAVRVAFAQRPPPKTVKVGRVDTVGAESYPDAFALIKAADPDFYGVAMDDRTDAIILLMSAAIEAESPGKIMVFQSDDADWLTSGLPAALTALDTRERSIVAFHTSDVQWADWGWTANRLAFNPDERSVPWDAEVKEVLALSPLPTDAQKAFLDTNNANHGLPYGTANYFVDPGTNQNTRPIYEVMTADWYEIRLQARIADLKVAASARGEKIPIDASGQALILAEINAQFNIGVAAGHFVDGQTVAVAEDITAADITAQRLRFTGQVQSAASARLFQFTFNFSTSPIPTT